MAAVTQTKRPRIFYGWWIVLAAAIMNIYVGGTLNYGFTAMVNPLLDEFGWSRAALSAAFALTGVEGAVIGPLVGWGVDRWGARRLMLLGFTFSGLGFFGLSRVNDLLGFYAMFMVVSLGNAPLWGGVSAALANWFVRRRGLALGVMLAGYGLSGTLVPLVVWAVANWQWRGTVLAIGLGIWGLCLPLTMLIRHRPQPYGYLPDGDPPDPSATTAPDYKFDPKSLPGYTLREALGSHVFWLIAIGFTLSWMALSAVVVHLVPYLVSVGIDRETAALAVTFLTMMSVVGRVGIGWLGDLVNKRYLIAACFAAQAVALLIFAFVSQPWHLIPFLAIMGPAYGGAIPLRLSLQGEYFGVRAFATISAVMGATSVVTAFSPTFAGWVFDVSQSYRPAWFILSVFGFAAIPVILLARPPRPRLDPEN